ncbi:NADH:flavin oxidoreductase [Variovorax sp. Sphag1AA]|uniref:NADH:flavin oxidoreductase n=1 Tax=Variovorax sp. Sphag1AA TaxID=2587027 RepID=UPI0016178F83|nr:NADH:flavin oxidoreductase [Variovorax sp. Sphag1AA]MBB3182252.1 2,4-dienoyl-CoA reductase-like NADH-dependent reductase (Old Yellow Enzyme family) [Variovorax sp. Sphag1AA]
MNHPSFDALFQPFSVKSLSLKNRIVMAPMTRFFSPQGLPGEDVAAYYRRRAEAEVGLILSEGTTVERPAARNDPNIPYFHGEAALSAWKRVIGGVHAAGGRMGPQLWHVGAVKNALADWNSGFEAESPSGLAAPSVQRGEVMSEEAIADTVAAFGRAAADAKALGFDTVEVHGAHGYLIDQFFWSGTNRRNDRYGGLSLKERARFAAEVIKAIRVAVGDDYPIILRLSQWKQQDYKARLADTVGEMSDWLVPLVEAGADVLHCSQRRFWEAEFSEIDGTDGLNFAGWAKKLTGATTISVGSVGLSGEFIRSFAGEGAKPASLDNLIRRMEREEFDLIAVGRALLSDPLWASKVRTRDLASLQDFNPSSMRELV